MTARDREALIARLREWPQIQCYGDDDVEAAADMLAEDGRRLREYGLADEGVLTGEPALRARIAELEAERADWRYNFAQRAFTDPTADLDTMLRAEAERDHWKQRADESITATAGVVMERETWRGRAEQVEARERALREAFVWLREGFRRHGAEAGLTGGGPCGCPRCENLRRALAATPRAVADLALEAVPLLHGRGPNGEWGRWEKHLPGIRSNLYRFVPEAELGAGPHPPSPGSPGSFGSGSPGNRQGAGGDSMRGNDRGD